MTKEEVMKKRDESMQAIQQGLGIIESVKSQVAAHRGKVMVYDELLLAFGEPKPEEGEQG